MVLAGTAQEAAVRALGCRAASEIFADRAYNDDASLVDRSQPGAVIHDPELTASRVIGMLKEGAIIAESGKRIPVRIDTICLHGDTPGAIHIARGMRQRLADEGINLARFTGSPL